MIMYTSSYLDTAPTSLLKLVEVFGDKVHTHFPRISFIEIK